eukprot:297544_1
MIAKGIWSMLIIYLTYECCSLKNESRQDMFDTRVADVSLVSTDDSIESLFDETIWIIPPNNEYVYIDINSSQNISAIATRTTAHTNFQSIKHLPLYALLFISCVALYIVYNHKHSQRLQTQLTRRVNVQDARPLNNVQIILDYDDTLFPTHYLISNMKKGIFSSQCIDQCEWDELCHLNSVVYQTLSLLIELFGASNICIVSNASLSWMNESCLIFNGLYQNIRNFVIQHQIQVISATDSYQSQKSAAFTAMLGQKADINKVICIGDSEQEYIDIDIACSAIQAQTRRSLHYCRLKLEDKPSL